MKNLYSVLGIALAASLSIISCTKDPVAPAEIVSGEGVPFEISTLITKTSNDGLNTKWAAEDQINLFHAEAGTTTYVNDNSFTVDEGLAGNFSGTLTSALTDGKSYDWYAFYPYSSYITTPANSTGFTYIGCRSDKSQSQVGNDSKAHLSGAACPLYGIAKDVAAEAKPAIVMKNLASVVAIKVTNTLDEALTVSSVSFTSTENIVGQFGVDFSSDTPDYVDGTYASATANLSVTDGTAIAKNASATFYIAIKPHAVKSGSNLVIAVNGIEKTLTLPKDVTFTAGSIKTIGYKYEKSEDDLSGQYLILNKDKTKVCPAFTSGYNIPAETYSEAAVQASWVMTISKVDGTSMYTIQDSEGNYLSTGASENKNYLVGLTSADENRSRWSITANSDGSYSIVASNSSYRNNLKYNSSNTLFSCYSSGQSAVTLIKYVPKMNLATPSIAAEVQNLNAIYVTWDNVANAKDYTVTCTEKDATAPTSTQTVTVDEYTFTGLKYATEYTVSVVANPTDTDTYYSSAAATETLTTGNLPALATPVIATEVQNLNSIKVSWAAITGAKNYTVSYKKTSSTAAATSIDVTELEYTISELEYGISYTVSVVANPDDEAAYSKSAAAEAEVTTGKTDSNVYILEPAKSTNNSYAGSADIEINGITWNVTGNSNQVPWRIGGKSLAKVDRAIYSKTAITDKVTSIKVTHGTSSGSITVNSMTLTVYNTADDAAKGTNAISTVTGTYEASRETTFTAGNSDDWTGKYYRIVYNITVSGNSNKYITFSKAEFYK